MSIKGQRQRRQRQQRVPPSGQKPEMNLAPRDLEARAEELVAYPALFHALFQRREQRQWSEFYLRGHLSDLERKTIEPMVLALQGPDGAAVRAVQQCVSEGAWDDETILARHQQLVAESLGAAAGSVLIDGSGFPKQGTHSVGVAPQYCGALGKVANCQQGVFAVSRSTQGYTFLDRRLYMPQEWFDAGHASLRQRYGVPKELRFTTEPQLALEMVQGLVERGEVPFRWVLADERYGRDPGCVDGVATLGKWYFVEVPGTTRVWRGRPAREEPRAGKRGGRRKHARVVAGTPPAQEVRQLAVQVPPTAWRPYTIKDGTKGPIVADFAFLRVTRTLRRGRPGAPAWAVFRRSRGEDRAVKYFLSNASASCPRRELVRRSGLRWPVETAIEEAKGELGLDHYEVRTWRGWHHHMTQTFLAHHFLVRLRLQLKKSPGADSGPSPSAVGRRAAPAAAEPRRGLGPRALSPGTQLCGLLLASETHAATEQTAGPAAREEI
jgi:SRSO17 transposase